MSSHIVGFAPEANAIETFRLFALYFLHEVDAGLAAAAFAHKSAPVAIIAIGAELEFGLTGNDDLMTGTVATFEGVTFLDYLSGLVPDG